MFMQRPEHDDEWTGIPSEPAHPETVAERLADAPPIDIVSIATGGAVESIVIPVAPIVEIADSQEAGEQ